MKKIVIAPIFNDTHLVKLQIPNIIKSINPDYILYNEGMFPSGPESNTSSSMIDLLSYNAAGSLADGDSSTNITCGDLA